MSAFVAHRLDAFCPSEAQVTPSPTDRWADALQRASGLDLHEWPLLDDDALDVVFAAAGRVFGAAPVEDAERRPADEVARALVLAIRVRRADGQALAVVEERFRCGDNRERQAVLRALPHLPRPERFLRLGIHACRTHVTPIFEAIACANPYPADHFPDAAFNQMVLKTLFLSLPVGRIVGLDRRHTPELARMAAGYASERRAAGRVVPEDVAILTGGDER